MNIGYARVSTAEQNEQLQMDALEQVGCEEIYRERITGTQRERPELNACIRSLRAGDTLVVWKLDRLARSLRHLVEIVQDLENRDVAFRSLTESIDTTSAGGKLIFHVFAALAEFERALIRERTVAGLNAARARGRRGGRKHALTRADIRKAAAMLADPSITKTDVAAHFRVSRPTLNAALEREGYPQNPAATHGG